MATDPTINPLSEQSIEQNPSPALGVGQDYLDKVRAQTTQIMNTFIKVLPSNYVSRVSGPFYTLQFQAAAEQLAAFQVMAQEIFKDSSYDYTRPEFLWEIVGTLVFPGATGRGGAPSVDGDHAYRDFLKKMVLLLLKGSTADAVEEGAGFLTEADVSLVERFLETRSVGSDYTLDDQFFFDLFVQGGTPEGTGFPDNAFQLQENVQIILKALKPAHTLYGYSHLFTEAFGTLFDDSYSWELSPYYYDDFRKFCRGTKEISGTSGRTLSGRLLFSDPMRSFQTVQVGGLLRVTSGPNEGAYRIREVIQFPLPTDATARAYTTSPTGLSGTATVASGVITDTTQNWSLAAEGEQLTFTTGPNAGTYRLEAVLGNGGGPVGFTTSASTQVRVSPSMLRLETRMPSVATGQSYTLDVDRLGVKVVRTITAESVSDQFYR